MNTAPKMLDEAQLATVRRLWAEGESEFAIAVELRVSIDVLRARRRDQLRNLPARSRALLSKRRGEDPSPDEIRVRCEAIRRTWGPERFETAPERVGRIHSGHL